MDPNTQNALAELRDIHLPPPVSWWPPAPGWLLLGTFAIIMSVLSGIYIYKKWKTHKTMKAIMKKATSLTLRHKMKSGNDLELIQESSILLKQVMFLSHPRKIVAGLSGDAWLAFLDQQTQSEDFTQGVGRLLLSAPYQAQAPQETSALLMLVEKTILSLLSRKNLSP